MGKPASFCTIVTNHLAHEAFGFLLSLGLHHPGAKVWVAVSAKSEAALRSFTPAPNLDLRYVTTEDEGSRSKICQHALNENPDVLFAVCNTIVVEPFEFTESAVPGLPDDASDAVWVSSADTLMDWDSARSEVKRCGLSCAIVETAPEDQLYAKMTTVCSNITYEDAVIRAIYTNFSKKESKFTRFNLSMKKLMAASCKFRELAIISRVENAAWVYEMPEQPKPFPYNFNRGLAFRNLMVMFRGDTKLVPTQKNHPWLAGTTLIYDRPTTLWVDQETANAPSLLYCNGTEDGIGKALIDGTGLASPVAPSSFWARYPSILEKHVTKLRKYTERPFQSIFIGNSENEVQDKYRFANPSGWKAVVERFELVKGTEQKYTPEQFIIEMTKAKFGLCLRGYGEKCNRDIELMAVGTVPVITPEVNITAYANPPIEGVHFLRASSPDEFKRVVESVSPKKWAEMSAACNKWYLENSHSSSAHTLLVNTLLKTPQMPPTTVHFIVPVTSRGSGWKNVTESHLFKTLLLSTMKTNDPSRGVRAKFVIGVDAGDPIYTPEAIHAAYCKPSLSCVDGIDVVVFDESVKKGHLTKMWNILAKKAIDDGAEYLFQCGDDVEFVPAKPGQRSVIECLVKEMRRLGGLACVAPKGDNYAIVTQALFSRRHVELFDCLMPEEIFNWHCDDWYNTIYKQNGLLSIIDTWGAINKEKNFGNAPARYDVVRSGDILQKRVGRDAETIAAAKSGAPASK